MNRLTEYRKDLNRYEYKQDEKGYCFIQEGQIVNKLGHLEDLEEQLDVVFRALKQGYIYFEFEDTGFLKWNVTDLEYFETFEKFALVNINGVNVGLASGVNGTYANLRKDAFFLNDYKKTWWLKEDMSE